ncbi:hypothetical protein F4679DRAFT_596884 [Xylaria curta]|nr:hypothetical protein F4679DRAFT_596884 [Xylaria curta]
MSFMYDYVGGIAFWKADEALNILLNDPQKLERARSRFSRPPPTYRSDPSGATTLLHSPSEPNEEERWLEKRRYQLSEQYRASLAASQFEAQVYEEANLYEENKDGIYTVPIGVEYLTYARKNVKKRWVEQGIWNKNWKWGGGMWGGPIWSWKHEKPLELEPELQTVPEAKIECPSYSPFPWTMRSEYETAEEENSEADDSEEDDSDEEDEEEEQEEEQKDDEETKRIKRARDLREREREASRPFYQFVYQLSKEREKIQQQLRRNGETIADPDDISTAAYEAIKKVWVERGIWDEKWGIMPGMSWRHEQQSLEEWVEQQMTGVTWPGPTTPPGPCTFNETNLMDFRSVSPPAEPNHEAFSTNLDGSVPMVIDAPGIPDIVHNDTVLNSTVPYDTALNTSRHTSPPPSLKERRPRGRPRKVVEKSPQDLPTLESPVLLRRSKRLQEAKATVASDTVVGRRDRPKRGSIKADDSAHGISARDARALKRRALKQKRTQP